MVDNNKTKLTMQHVLNLLNLKQVNSAAFNEFLKQNRVNPLSIYGI